MTRRSPFSSGLALLLATFLLAPGALAAPPAGTQWYKGNTHAHTLWSDGDSMPEIVADWYKSHGYQFLVFTDHNETSSAPRWLVLGGRREAVFAAAIGQCRKRLGADAVGTRRQDGAEIFRLPSLEDVARRFDEGGKFLLIRGEEITTKAGPAQVHLNAINLADLIPPDTAPDVQGTLRRNLWAVQKQSQRTARPMLVHVNHPNWPQYDISAEDLASVTEARLFEVCNGSPGTNHFGDANHAGTEKLWDVANTIRLAKLKSAPLMGVASDDAHHYREFDGNHDNPGRAWVVVRAATLSADSLIEAMNRGDFYASTGVTLKDVRYDANAGTLAVEVQPEEGVRYTIEFIGTLAGTDPASCPAGGEAAAEARGPGGYSNDIGKVLHSVAGAKAQYKLTGKELYVRAAIRSDKPMGNPANGELSKQQAWTQPVGWEKRVAPAK